MNSEYSLARKLALVALLVIVVAAPSTAWSGDSFDNGSLRGVFILSIDGTFVSAPPPFTGNVLPFAASQIGHLEFDGAGLATGEATLVFHHPDIPFGVVSRVAFSGTYNVAANGKAIINLDEFPLDMNGEPGTMRANSLVMECYIVRRGLRSNCILHTLISYRQGPDPRNLPVTMSGTLHRQL